MEYERVLVLNDLHIPFHDKYAVKLLYRVIGVYQPTMVILNGDLLDFYILSDFDQDPERIKEGLQSDLDEFDTFLDGLYAVLPEGCKVAFIPGNHEDRLRRYLWRHRQLHGLHALDLSELMGLTRRGITFYDKEVILANGRLIVKHGNRVRPQGGASAFAELEQEKYQASTITGHTHRMGSTMVRTRYSLVGGWENGCLCDLHPEYIKGVPVPNWQHGLALVTVAKDGESFAVTQVPFLGEGCEMKAVVEGKMVRI